MALMLIPISGGIAFAVEQGSWYYFQRSMQNAADSAAIAAASNDTAAGSAYRLEGKGVAARFGFVDGVSNTTVQIDAPTACPADATQTCYKATISTIYPLIFSRLLGFSGDASSGRAQTIMASAVARTAGGGTGTGTPTPACYWALSTAPDALTGHGIPFANLTGCSVFSNGGIDCTGHDMGADYALAALSTSRPDCARPLAATGDTRTPPVDKYGFTLPPDPYGGAPYSTLAASAAASPCTSSPPTQGSTAATLIVYCGDLAIGANKTLTLTSPNTVVVIRNGSLDLTAVGSKIIGASATIVFDGTQAPFGTQNIKGTIDIKAPDEDSGSPWKGVAIYRPSSGPDTSAILAGSQATWNITGLVYLPHVNVTVDGVVNKATGGSNCFVVVANTIVINGNGTILNTTDQCPLAGFTPPSVVIGGGTAPRVKLVL